ncbi:hypothetical protein [Sphingomonas sp. HMP9]|nr:hypothetical protein [Sphingomonas sp. HMP9]
MTSPNTAWFTLCFPIGQLAAPAIARHQERNDAQPGHEPACDRAGRSS